MSSPPSGDRRASAKLWLRDVRKATSWHRRLLASGLLAGSGAFALAALSPAPPPTVAVVAAARDLAGGTTLTTGQLKLIRLAPRSVPAGAVRKLEHARGGVLAAPVRAGEPLTDVRLLGGALLSSYGGDVVAVPIRVADAATAMLLRAGDVIDVLAAAAPEAPEGGGTATARLVASAVPVLALPQEKTASFGAGAVDGGALVVVAASDATAARLAAAAVTSRLSVTLRRAGQ